MAQSKLDIILGLIDKTGGIKNTKKSFTELNQAVELAKKAFQAINDVYKQTVQAAINQAVSQKSLARQMGGTAAEAGILLKVSDDLKVSQDVLGIAFKTMNKQGIQPTFENLVKLARQYQILPTSVEKNNFALKMFGKSGVEMQKILETNITELQDMGKAATTSGEILSGPVVEMMERFRKKLKESGDSVEGLKVQLGVFFTLLLEQANLGVGDYWSQRLKIQNEINVAVHDGAITQAEADAVLVKMTKTTMTNAEAMKWLAMKIGLTTSGITAMNHATNIASYASAQHTAHLGAANHAMTNASNGLAAYRYNLMQDQVYQQQLNSLLGQSADAFRNVQSATENLQQAQQNWNNTAGNDVANLLESYVGKGDRYQKALAAIDTTYGTGLTTQFNYQRDLKELVAQYAKGGDVENFKIKLKELQDKYQPLDDAVKASMKVLNDYKAVYDSIQSKIITLTTYHVDVYGSPPTQPTTGAGQTQFPNKPQQFGGAVMVGEHGPEMFVPSYAGHIVPANQVSYSITSNVYGAQGQSPNQIADAVMTRINKQVAAARYNKMGNTGM